MDLEGVREALHREPFQAFDICLADGRRVRVRHPTSVAIGNRRIIVVEPDDSVIPIESGLITSLDFHGTRPRRTDPRNKGKT